MVMKCFLEFGIDFKTDGKRMAEKGESIFETSTSTPTEYSGESNSKFM